MPWDDGVVRPVALAALGQGYRCYRLADPPAEEAMAGSLRRWGQLSPVVACVQGQQLQVLDGFKRLAAAPQVAGWTTLSVRVIDVDERTAKAAILDLNRGQRRVRELEEAWVVQALVRDDGLTQVEAAQLLGQHKSWVCRRLALLEKLSAEVKEDLRLGLVGPALARQLTRLPAGNQQAVLALTRREALTAQEVSGVVELLQGAGAEQTAFVLAQPRAALAQAHGVPTALRDPRLSRAGNFTREGRRRVYLFSYLLAYSRRQYLRWVESMDLLTTLREHVHAFRYLGGVARVCRYDNFKAVVLWRDADGPRYNPKFLAFATHYAFRPQACQVRRPQTKGKVERQFFYVETSLLNGRTFDTREHLNEVTRAWLAQVADVRILRDFKETPRERHAREQPQLLPLPACDFDTALVIYRHVNVEGFIAYQLNFYSVPWSYIGQVLPVRVIEDEVIIYSIGLEEMARHRRVASTQSGARQIIKGHHPTGEPSQRTVLLKQRFTEFGPIAVQFLDGLLAKQIQGKLQAQQLLALVAHYQRDDVLKALERAVRFGAFSLAAIRRILAAQARPKPLLDELAELHKDALDPSLRQEPIGPRPTSDYQHLLSPEPTDEPPSEEKPTDPPDAESNRSEPA
jgi:ParB-like chromosome segregation protein Spo0J